MPQQPESVAEWMRIVRGDLALARTSPSPEVPLELLCFHAQQATEKAVKAVLIFRGMKPPRIHDIGKLLDLLPTDVPRTPEVEASRGLTYYATVSRYPWKGAPVSVGQCRDALRLAEAVVVWAAGIVGR